MQEDLVLELDPGKGFDWQVNFYHHLLTNLI